MRSIVSPVVEAPSRPAAPEAAERPGTRLFRMDNPVRGYDWGSTTTLPALQGRPPTGRPEAELWMGAHPAAPSTLVLDDGPRTLDAVLAERSELLGPECAARFDGRLPFLLKVLAIERALSIQVHPDSDQAARGHAREVASGVQPERRNYVDAGAKPELLCALDPVQALVGLRPVEQATALLSALGTPVVAPVLDALAAGGAAAAVEVLARWPQHSRDGLAQEAGRAAAVVAGTAPAPLRPALEWVPRLQEQHPGDPFVLAPLLLDLVRLEPLQAVYLPAGVPHAYLRGTGVEVMAASDNVLRAGLTSKRVDVDELLALLDPTAGPSLPAGEEIAAGQQVWRPPVAAFRLGCAQVAGPGATPLPDLGGAEPAILLCTAGEVTVSAGVGAGTVTLTPGTSAFLAAGAGPVAATGTGRLFWAAPGRG